MTADSHIFYFFFLLKMFAQNRKFLNDEADIRNKKASRIVTQYIEQIRGLATLVGGRRSTFLWLLLLTNKRSEECRRNFQKYFHLISSVNFIYIR
jgi:hypothetical protein